MLDKNGVERPPDEEGTAPEASLEDREDRRPTPARMAMEGAEGDEVERAGENRRIRDESQGIDWLVRVSGCSSSGILPLRSVPIMELTFAKAEAPERLLRRAVLLDGDLQELPLQDLLTALERSEPFTEPMREWTEERERERKGRKRRSSSTSPDTAWSTCRPTMPTSRAT